MIYRIFLAFFVITCIAPLPSFILLCRARETFGSHVILFYLWFHHLGNLYEQMNDPDRAENAYEHALRHNPESERALTQVASIARSRDDFPKVRRHASF